MSCDFLFNNKIQKYIRDMRRYVNDIIIVLTCKKKKKII